MDFKFVLSLVALCVCDVTGAARGRLSACKPTPHPPEPGSGCCGRDQAADELQISGIAAINQFPWIALIEDADKRITCTGTLISSRYVLTAAQCLYRDPKRVRMGDYNKTNSGPDCISAGGVRYCNEGAVAIAIESATAHPAFKQPNYQGHDIAIIKLAKAVPYTTFMRPICLPTWDITSPPPADLLLVNAGWGSKPASDHEDDVLKHYVQLPYKPLQECQNAYNTKHSRTHHISEHQICAGGENGLDSCRGDGGGPLMHALDGQYTLQGVVSYGPVPCGTPGVPSVYTKVHAYLPWITSVIGA